MKSLRDRMDVRVLRIACAVLLAMLLGGLSAIPASAVTLAPRAQKEPNLFELSIDPTVPEATYSLGTPVLYVYGPGTAGNTPATGGREARISLLPRTKTSDAYRITNIAAQSVTANVAASTERGDGTAHGGRTAPVLTLRSTAPAGDCEPQDYEVRLTITVGEIAAFGVSGKRDIVVTIRGEGSAAYSQVREVEGGGRYHVSEESGCVFHADGTVGKPARVSCNGQVAVEFSGEYEGDYANLLVSSEEIGEVERRASSGVQYADFVGAQTLSAPVKIYFDGPDDAFIYEYHRESGTFTRIVTSYESDAHVFTTSALGCFLLSPDEL